MKRASVFIFIIGLSACTQIMPGRGYRTGDPVQHGDPLSEHDIALSKPTFKDRWCTAKIKGKFLLDYLVKGEDIDILAHNGVVTLRGFVKSSKSRKRAISIAKDTEGVRDVVSELKVIDRQHLSRKRWPY